MTKYLLLLLPVLVVVAVAQTRAPQQLWGTIFNTVAPIVQNRQIVAIRSNSSGIFVTDVAVGQVGKLLLVDGASFLLQTNGVSKICLAGGC